MNKYQEALDNIADELIECGRTKDLNGETILKEQTELNLLQELVNRATPKRPVTKGGYTDFKCPVCGRRVRSGRGSSSRQKDNVCQRCFQVLDWSDENDRIYRAI